MNHEDYNGGLHAERDMAAQQLKVQHANLTVIKMALNENRPLEALQTANNAIDEADDVIDRLEQLEAARDAEADATEDDDV